MKIIELISNTLLVDKFRLEGKLEETLNHTHITHTERLDMSIKTLKELNEVIQTINFLDTSFPKSLSTACLILYLLFKRDQYSYLDRFCIQNRVSICV